MLKGTVRWFNTMAGFGYIQQNNDNKTVFVHLKDVEASGLIELHEGQELTFDTALERGHEYAINIKTA